AGPLAVGEERRLVEVEVADLAQVLGAEEEVVLLPRVDERPAAAELAEIGESVERERGDDERGDLSRPSEPRGGPVDRAFHDEQRRARLEDDDAEDAGDEVVHERRKGNGGPRIMTWDRRME